MHYCQHTLQASWAFGLGIMVLYFQKYSLTERLRIFNPSLLVARGRWQ